MRPDVLNIYRNRSDEYSDEEFIEFIIMLKSKRHITRYKNLTKFEREMEKYKTKLARVRAEAFLK